MVLAVGTAAADEPGRCNETVKVHAEPNLDAPEVGVCPAGTAVRIGEIREGYLYLTDYAGWAAWEYLTIDDPADTAPADTDPAAGTGRPGVNADDRRDHRRDHGTRLDVVLRRGRPRHGPLRR
jgi:hypothetical protein